MIKDSRWKQYRLNKLKQLKIDNNLINLVIDNFDWDLYNQMLIRYHNNTIIMIPKDGNQLILLNNYNNFTYQTTDSSTRQTIDIEHFSTILKEFYKVPVIDTFDKQNEYLSNFYNCDILYNGITYPSVENGYQGSKSINNKIRKIFSKITSSESKQLGKEIKLRTDWERVKDDIMIDLLYIKFTTNDILKERLNSTGNSILIEGNYWHDNYWGVCTCPMCNDVRESPSVLGSNLMILRDHLFNTVTYI